MERLCCNRGNVLLKCYWREKRPAARAPALIGVWVRVGGGRLLTSHFLCRCLQTSCLPPVCRVPVKAEVSGSVCGRALAPRLDAAAADVSEAVSARAEMINWSRVISIFECLVDESWHAQRAAHSCREWTSHGVKGFHQGKKPLLRADASFLLI